MICTKCGKTTPGALKRCIGCGARLAEQPGAGEFLRGEFPELTEPHRDPTEQQAATGVLTPTPPMPTPPTPMPTLPTSVFPPVATVADTPVPTSAAPGPDPGDGDAPTILAGGDQLRVLASHSPATPSGPDETVLLPADRASRYERPTNGSASAALRTDDGPLAVGQAFGPRYHIIRMLGVGGMGAVYQAWDAELGLAVAIKVIRPEITADPQTAADVARRFKRELVLARQVTHKNVVRIHDLGEIDGIKYITMPYIEGDDLATLIKKHNELPVPRALRITRSIVSGLVAAHTAGVVHRDLKPANIMIDDEGEALIMDFGIARSTGAPVGNRMPGEQTIVDNLRQVARQADATVYGAVVGTVAYMAPEQARGVSVDQRADVYALGLIFYDMLVGRSRAASGNPILELQARMEKPPPAVKTLVPEVPAALDAVISRCLEPDPGKRFQTTVELLRAFEQLDQDGKPLPKIRRLTRRTMSVATILVAVLLGVTFYVTRWITAPPEEREPVSVLIADFENATGDPAFNRTLEPMIRRVLEDAGFISAYDRNGVRSTFGARPPEKLDEAAAREIALKEVLGIVLSGSIERQGSGYAISMKATETVTGKVIEEAKTRASSKEQVLGEATELVTSVREALGDETSDSAKLFARSISSTSLEVVGLYAAAVESNSNGRSDLAAEKLQQAVTLDPNFGIGYLGLAAMSQNMSRLQDADKYITEALRHLQGMSERERLSTRGFSNSLTGDYRQCEKEYSELITRNKTNVAALNQRAKCLSKLRDMHGAVEDMTKAVHLVQGRVLYRNNLAVYSVYAGDFLNAEQQLQAIQEPNDLSILALAFAQLGQGRVQEAAATYDRLEKMSARGASWAASGRADLALYEGRLGDAARRFDEGAAASLAADNPDQAARKLTALAHVHLVRGRPELAVVAAEKALGLSKATATRFLAARLLAEAGEIEKARIHAFELASSIAAEPQAYGKIIEGVIALKKGELQNAITILNDANKVLDTWLGHFDLGRAYLQAGANAQADSEFDKCIKRSGEALSLMVDEEPTYGYFPPVYYFQGRVREAMNTAGYADSYREYLKIRGKFSEDPLLLEIRKRAGS